MTVDVNSVFGEKRPQRIVINKCYFKHDLFMGHIFLTTFMQIIKHSIVDSIDLS